MFDILWFLLDLLFLCYLIYLFILLNRVSGYMMSDKLVIPRLRVKQNWYVGLNPDPVDRSHPDVHDDQLIQEALIESLARKFCSSPFPPTQVILANTCLKAPIVCNNHFL